jgi:hypothetical protein
VTAADGQHGPGRDGASCVGAFRNVLFSAMNVEKLVSVRV